MADRLLRDIASGKLKAGDRLAAEPALASRMGVSRPTLRQALKSLEAAGILVSRPRRGTRLSAPSPGSLASFLGAHLALAGVSPAEIAEARALLEAAAVRLAARRRSARDLAAMRTAVEEMERAEGRTGRILAAERRFHGAIVEAARNPALSALRELIAAYFAMTRPRYGLAADKAIAERTLRGHREILAAVERRDEDRAAAAMLRHLAPTLSDKTGGKRR